MTRTDANSPNPGTRAAHDAEAASQPPRSVPPLVPSLAPPHPDAAGSGHRADLSNEHAWLADARLALLRRTVSDELLVAIRQWGINPMWSTNQIVSHVHATLAKKADRKLFESALTCCQDKAALLELVHVTLSTQPPPAANPFGRF